MKTKRLVLSIAVVAFAVIGAFASANLAAGTYRYRVDESDPITCTTIKVNCDLVTNFQCKVNSPAPGIRLVYANSTCTVPIFHSSPEILSPAP